MTAKCAEESERQSCRNIIIYNTFGERGKLSETELIRHVICTYLVIYFVYIL